MSRRSLRGLIVLWVCLAIGCSLIKKKSSNQVKADDDAETEIDANDSDGAWSGVFTPGSNRSQTLKAPSSSPIYGASVTLSPGSFAIATDISLSAGADLTGDSSLREINLQNNAVLSAGPAVMISSSSGVDPAMSMVLMLPAPAAPALVTLAYDSNRIAVLFRVQSGDSKRSGLIPRSRLLISDKGVEVKANYFGIYQVVYLRDPVESAIEVATTAPIESQKASEQRNAGPVAGTNGNTGNNEAPPQNQSPVNLAPTLPNGGVIAATDIMGSRVTLSWDAASDDNTPQALLQYRVYFSTADNISTVATAETNGTSATSYNAGMVSFDITGLSESTTYYVNVVVKDAAGLKTAYSAKMFATSELVWINLGAPNTETEISDSAMAIGSDDLPIVASHNGGGDVGAITVSKYLTATSWQSLGSPGNSLREIEMKIDPVDGRPVLAFCDADDGQKVVVRKWSSGLVWNTLGGGPVNQSYCTAGPGLAISHDGHVFVAFPDNGQSNRLYAFRFDPAANSWTALGEAEVALGVSVYSQPRLEVGPDGFPYIAYNDNDSDPALVKLNQGANGYEWTSLGKAATGNGGYQRLTLDRNHLPVVSYGNENNSVATVVRWTTGTTWEVLGDSNEQQYRQAPIAFESRSNQPFILYRNWGGNGEDAKMRFKKLIGTGFVSHGPSVVSREWGWADCTQLVLNSADEPIIYIRDDESGRGAVYILQ